jgi:hypothetical protein
MQSSQWVEFCITQSPQLIEREVSMPRSMNTGCDNAYLLDRAWPFSSLARSNPFDRAWPFFFTEA